MLRRLRNWLGTLARRLDRRAWVVLAALAVTLAATAAVYAFGLGLDPATHFGAVFAGWVSGVALFVVLGVVVAIVSLDPPERASFDARARILFRRQTGPHIDYIVRRIGNVLEHYAESSAVTVSIDKYHAGERKYRISVLQETRVRSYIDDIESRYSTTVEYAEVTPPPADEQANRLVFIRIDGRGIEGSRDFRSEISRPITTTVVKDNAVTVSFNIEFWVEAESEPNQLSCSRFTQSFRLFFENRLNRPVNIRMLAVPGADEKSVHVRPGGRELGAELFNREPNAPVFDFRLLAH